MNFIYKLFGKYFAQYKNNVVRRIGSLIRVTDEEILEVALEELNSILEILAGRKTSKLDIPQYNRFPNSAQFNTLITNVDIDLDKLFNGMKIIVQDVQNVVNYNSTEREAITQLLADTQAQVYSAYISSRKGIDGTTIIKEDFINVDKINLLSTNSENVTVSPTLKRLSLKPLVSVPVTNNSSVVTDSVDAAHFIEQEESYNLYPNKFDLVPGSFWRVKSSSHHHGKRDSSYYKDNLITRRPTTTGGRHSASGGLGLAGAGSFGSGRPSSSSELDSCQFESVLTIDTAGDLEKRIEQEVAKEFEIPTNYIFINRPISIHSKYITQTEVTPTTTIKVKIPFKDAELSTGCVLSLNPSDGLEFPDIIAAESFVRADVTINGIDGSNKVGVSYVSQETTDIVSSSEQLFTVAFDKPVVPVMLELVFAYGSGSGWSNVGYFMQEWIVEFIKYVDIKSQVQYEEEETLTIEYVRKIHVLVDDLGDNNEEVNEVLELLFLEGVK